jgi:hypothetical protein
MNNEITLVKRIEILEDTIIKLSEKILILESLNKCSDCNNINLLFICIICNNKICSACCNKVIITKDDDIIYYCKHCKQ